MYELTVEAEFSAAHCLRDYQGACARLHGHNYRVVVHLAGEQLDAHGMLMDFREARRLCESAVEALDHQHLNDLPEFERDNPTTENIARHLFQRIRAALEQARAARERSIRLVKVTVYESPRSSISYSEGEG